MYKYRIEKFEKEISVEEYLEGYVAVDEFIEYCKTCPNYGNVWACPPYDFDVISLWKKYTNLKVFARKIIFEPDITQEESMEIMYEVKEDMSRQMFELEAENPGSLSLSAGSCTICGKGNCTRPSGELCRHEEKMRYSIESLGGNVGLTCRKLMGLPLEWIEEGKIPSYFVLCTGLLIGNKA